MIIVNTGNGKGKTTAAIGQIVRALGGGFKVCVIQLFKGKEFYGEQNIIKKLDNLKLYSYASKHPFCFPEIPRKTVLNQCDEALKKLKAVLNAANGFDLIVLDEFNVALNSGYIKLNELRKIIAKNKNKTDFVITGRYAPKELLKIADIVTEMKEIKHPFSKGMIACKGIEY